MTATWIYVAVAIVLDGCAALVAGLIPEGWIARARMPMLGFAAGILLGTTFLDLLPEAMSQLSPATVLAVALGSLLTMVLLEWTIGHRAAAGSGRGRLAVTLLGADAFHNAADGAAIGAAFVLSPRLGVITALAVIAHEVPEEVADYVLLREAGMSKRRALLAMAGVQLTAAIGAIVALAGASFWKHVSGVALSIAAGTFLHIAEVDLVPTVLEMVGRRRERVVALGALLFGVGVVVAETFW
jgi:zinc and cadmium transporter